MPENGLDRCPCGCKYWTADGRCTDCGDHHRPDDDDDDDTVPPGGAWPKYRIRD